MSGNAARNIHRLPSNAKPTHYDLTIRTDLEASTFEGVVSVQLDIEEACPELTFNSVDLILGKASIASPAFQKNDLVVTLDTSSKQASISFGSTLPKGSTARLTLGFSGKLDDSLIGYYRSSWQVNSTTKYYALTQFEAIDARRAFPCWDEPQLKATFSIALISRADTVNLSNMPVLSEEPIRASTVLDHSLPTEVPRDLTWKITRFDKTPPMSTYIVAFANGPFEFLESNVTLPLSNKTIPLRIYATPDLIHQAQFALDVKANVLPLYERLFDVAFPLPKLDTLTVTDFDSGAMENWGLITGRTSAFLVDPQRAGIREKKLIITVQSHEVAHMWFGNITTMAWWDYLYLNEGFATLMGEVIIPSRSVLVSDPITQTAKNIDSIYPEYKWNSDFIDTHLDVALALDSKLSSHPVEVACPNAEHIGQIFDHLSYSKAGSVLRMLANYVGEEKFLKGVSLYLKDNLYGNTVTTDLWKGISKATGLNITQIMDNWISQMGFPVLTVTESPNKIRVRQDRFLETGIAPDKHNETLWHIPLFVISANDEGEGVVDRNPVLKERQQEFTLDTSKPFKLNSGTYGVYRVNYTPDRLRSIAIEATKSNSIFSVDDRMGLVYDAFALARAGISQLSNALGLVNIFRNEDDYLVWSVVAQSLANLVSLWWESPGIVSGLNQLRRSLFVPLVEKLGYAYDPSDSPDTRQLRTCAIEQAVSADDENVIVELRQRFNKFMKDGDTSSIPPDLERIIYRIGMQYGGQTEFDFLKKIHQHPPTPAAGRAARIALSMVQDEGLLEQTFDVILNHTRDQDVMAFFRGFEGNRFARRLVVEFFKKECDNFSRRFEKAFTMRYLIEPAFSVLTTEKDYKESVSFFEGKDTSKYHLALSQSLDNIQSRIAYIKRSTKDAEKWLEEWRKE